MAFTSLSNGVSGMQTNQQGMNVISNNISNVNTAGFKSSQANFSDMFYDDVSGATPEVNPVQVGYGSQVADVTKNMASTTATSTGNPQNVYIDGNGYIAVSHDSRQPLQRLTIIRASAIFILIPRTDLLSTATATMFWASITLNQTILTG